MKKMISHESPICLLKESLEYNDYDYALVHLFENNEKYYNFFKKSLDNNRHVILDNSLFELGESFNEREFAKWIKKLKPTEYIVPDTLNDCDATIKQFESWKKIKKELNIPGKTIGVVHGKDKEEFIKCYKYMEKNADKIAFNYIDNIYTKYIKLYTNNDVFFKSNEYYIAYCRINLIGDLLLEGIINTDIPHHLLGCSVPQEFELYKDKKYDFIKSIDTSNPIVHSILGIKYEDYGLTYKNTLKLYKLLNIEKEKIDMDLLKYNVSKFRRFVNDEIS